MTESINIEAPIYSEATRDLEDRFKEATYTDLHGRSIDYGALDSATIASITADLRTRHGAAIDAFTAQFARDEMASGRSEAEAQARAARYVDEYFEDLWDVQADLARDAGH